MEELNVTFKQLNVTFKQLNWLLYDIWLTFKSCSIKYMACVIFFRQVFDFPLLLAFAGHRLSGFTSDLLSWKDIWRTKLTGINLSQSEEG